MADTNPGGRPTVVTDDVVRNLENSLQNGFTVRKACELAGISHEAYYSRCESDQTFADRMDRSKRFVEEAARQNITVDIVKNKDSSTSKWYLERKVKKEFGTRTEVTGKDGEPIDTGTIKLAEALEKIYETEHNPSDPVIDQDII